LSKETPPSVKPKAFDCPYCGAYTTQIWSKVWAKNVDSEGGLPFFPDENFRNDLLNLDDHPNNEKFLEYFRRFDAKALFIEEHGSAEYVYNEVVNAVHQLIVEPCHLSARFVDQVSPARNVRRSARSTIRFIHSSGELGFILPWMKESPGTAGPE